jgi:hypothetical protein
MINSVGESKFLTPVPRLAVFEAQIAATNNRPPSDLRFCQIKKPDQQHRFEAAFLAS